MRAGPSPASPSTAMPVRSWSAEPNPGAEEMDANDKASIEQRRRAAEQQSDR